MKIPLSNGEFATIDPEDYTLIAGYNWRVHKSKRSRVRYVVADTPMMEGRKFTIMMHRLILCDPPYRVDHRNQNGLDNRRQNLRPATRSQNAANKKKPKNNTSGFKGVSWHALAGKWRATIKVNQKWKHLGLFTNRRAAARAYAKAAERWFGEFAYSK